MSRLISLSTVSLALLLIVPMTLEAGPRGGGRGGAGGGGGGARGAGGGGDREAGGGGARPNMGGGGNFGGGNFGGGNFSGGQNRGDRSGLGGGNGPAGNSPMGRGGQFGGGDRGLQNPGGNSRLSSALEGGNLDKFGGNGPAGDRNSIGNGRPNNGQLNSFLGIDGGRDNVNPVNRDVNPANRDLSDRNLNVDNRNLTDRNMNVDNRDVNNRNLNVEDRDVNNRNLDNRNVDVRQNNTNMLNNNNINNVNVNNNGVNARGGQIYNNMNGYWNNGPRPFSNGWYGAHPGAWNYRYPGGNAWAAASFGAVTGWMIGASTTPTNYVYSDSYYYPAGTTVDDQQTYAAQQATDASQLASSAPLPTADDGEQWMPLGVYAIVDGQDATSSKMLLQLAVSKSGNLAGTYYHAQTGNSQTVHGAVDLKTQQVAWQIGDNTSVTFQTDLESLTKEQTPVLVHYASGQSEQVQMVRMPDEDAPKP